MQQDGIHKVGTDGVLLGSWFMPHDERHILDIGTGTGVIALMAAQRTTARVTALDADPSAVALAEKNFEGSPWSDRVRAVHQRLQGFQPEDRYSHILSNPPFFLDSLLPDDPARLRQRHAENLPFHELAEGVIGLLAPEGRFSVILPRREGEQFAAVAAGSGLFMRRLCMVHPKEGKPPHRLLMEFRRAGGALETDTLYIMTAEAAYTAAYRALGKDFYLGF